MLLNTYSFYHLPACPCYAVKALTPGKREKINVTKLAPFAFGELMGPIRDRRRDGK